MALAVQLLENCEALPGKAGLTMLDVLHDYCLPVRTFSNNFKHCRVAVKHVVLWEEEQEWGIGWMVH